MHHFLSRTWFLLCNTYTFSKNVLSASPHQNLMQTLGIIYYCREFHFHSAEWESGSADKKQDSSAGRESACNAGDPGSIPGMGRFPGQGIGYPFQYSWASLVAQTVKNPPAMWEIWVQSLDSEDPRRRAWQPTPVFLTGESSWTEEPGTLQSMGSQRVGHEWTTSTNK